jgi:hypothetical protein
MAMRYTEPWKNMKIESPSTKISHFDNTSILTFKNPDTEVIFEITREGEIKIGKGYIPTEAADSFLKRMAEIMPDFVNSKTEHLQKENTELNQRVKELEDVNHRLTNANNDLVVVAQAWREHAILEQNR